MIEALLLFGLPFALLAVSLIRFVDEAIRLFFSHMSDQDCDR